MLQVRIADTLRQVEAAGWDGCFPGALEDRSYLEAVEEAGLPGFGWRYLTAVEDGRTLAAAAAFLTDYRLDTTLDGAAARWAGRLHGVAPKLLTQKLACLGSPCTEAAPIGFAVEVGDADRHRLARALLETFEAEAARQGCGLLGFKDVDAALRPAWDQVWAQMGYSRIEGQPSAWLPVDFPDLDAYLARLSPATRKDMRRKLRSFADVQVEVRSDFGAQTAAVAGLYQQTLARAEQRFETLTPDFFEAVPQRMGDRAVCVLYTGGGELLAANLLLSDGDTLLDKFFCMADGGRALNLYYLSWFTNLRLCLERGLGRYQSGQGSYANKLRLGSRLDPAWMAFKHRNPALNGLLKLAAPALALGVEA